MAHTRGRGTCLSADDPESEKGGNTVGVLVPDGFLEEGLYFVAGLGWPLIVSVGCVAHGVVVCKGGFQPVRLDDDPVSVVSWLRSDEQDDGGVVGEID